MDEQLLREAEIASDDADALMELVAIELIELASTEITAGKREVADRCVLLLQEMQPLVNTEIELWGSFQNLDEPKRSDALRSIIGVNRSRLAKLYSLRKQYMHDGSDENQEG